jgi:hypothetical protein
MDDQERSTKKGPTAGPLRVYEDESGGLAVIGFGLRIPVKSREEGLAVITELEDQGFRLCF